MSRAEVFAEAAAQLVHSGHVMTDTRRAAGPFGYQEAYLIRDGQERRSVLTYLALRRGTDVTLVDDQAGSVMQFSLSGFAAWTGQPLEQFLRYHAEPRELPLAEADLEDIIQACWDEAVG